MHVSFVHEFSRLTMKPHQYQNSSRGSVKAEAPAALESSWLRSPSLEKRLPW
jgi:hypothetical protein